MPLGFPTSGVVELHHLLPVVENLGLVLRCLLGVKQEGNKLPLEPFLEQLSD